jgi:hypothetical protein
MIAWRSGRDAGRVFHRLNKKITIVASPSDGITMNDGRHLMLGTAIALLFACDRKQRSTL